LVDRARFHGFPIGKWWGFLGNLHPDFPEICAATVPFGPTVVAETLGNQRASRGPGVDLKGNFTGNCVFLTRNMKLLGPPRILKKAFLDVLTGPKMILVTNIDCRQLIRPARCRIFQEVTKSSKM